MFRPINIVALCVLIAFNGNEAARILGVFPFASISHQVVFRPLTQALAKRGHEVIVITTDPAFPKGQAPENLTEIDAHDISYKIWINQIGEMNNGDKTDQSNKIGGIILTTLKVFEQQCNLPEVQDIIHNQNHTFDLILVEAWLRFPLGFSHVIKAPVIAVSSFGAMLDNDEVIGAPTHPFLYPQPTSTRLYNLSLWEKIVQIYLKSKIMTAYKRSEEIENTYMRRIFGEDTPALSELQNNVHMQFLNVHPIWDSNRPVPPGLIYMGGVHRNPQRDLPEDLKIHLDSSKNGVIYISFGTNVDPNMLPREKIQTMVEVLSKLPYDVLWKWDRGDLPAQAKNIKTSKWFPQSDLLRHPKVKLFIMQGGLQSTEEALIGGVPLLGIPMLGDQWYNCEKFVLHKIGMFIELENIETQSFRSAIETLIGDKSYRENIVRLRTLMDDQPMSPLDRAVWWTEHVLRHGGASHLRSPAANMPWTVYYEIDLVLSLLAALISVIALSVLVVYKVVKLILSRFSSDNLKTTQLLQKIAFDEVKFKEMIHSMKLVSVKQRDTSIDPIEFTLPTLR